jgi:hypothetical protein
LPLFAAATSLLPSEDEATVCQFLTDSRAVQVAPLSVDVKSWPPITAATNLLPSWEEATATQSLPVSLAVMVAPPAVPPAPEPLPPPPQAVKNMATAIPVQKRLNIVSPVFTYRSHGRIPQYYFSLARAHIFSPGDNTVTLRHEHDL